MAYDLSVVIPARNEMFLAQTVKNILENIEGNTEIIIGLDGEWANDPVFEDQRVSIYYTNKPIGQRAITNQMVKMSGAKYIMKIDAHCAVDKGFDVKMMSEMHDDWTMVPKMYNLHGFDWKCLKCGRRTYQGQSPKECTDCDNMENFERVIVWEPRLNKESECYRFDTTMHFQYDGARKHWGNNDKEDIIETMSIQGSCFMLTRDKYIELNICDEAHGSWGQQGVEVACKTWLSGGRVVTNKKTWYSHMFRTQGGDFGFPYPISGNEQERAREFSRDLWMNNKWDKQKFPLYWLIDKFHAEHWYQPENKDKLEYVIKKSEEFLGGRVKPLTKGIIFYTDSELDEKIARPVREQLLRCSKEKNIPIVSSSLKRMKFGDKNICFPSLKRGYLTMFKQIIGALENSTADVIFFCEHDVLYDPSHFDFTPPERDTFYYNQNVWMLRVGDGHCLHYDVNQLSGLCVYRDIALTHFKERYAMVEKEGYSTNMGFEPMTHHRIKWQNIFPYDTWMSEVPNVDIKHGKNATGQRWKKEEYRNQQLLKNWTESESIPGWGPGIDIVGKLLSQ